MPYRTQWLTRRRHLPPPAMVIFDCDGVLIDSEAICSRVVARELTALGWPMTAEAAEARFIGQSFHDMRPLIEAQLGRTLDAGWIANLAAQVTTVLANEAETVPGATEALHATTAFGLTWRIASNSSYAEMAAKFGRTGLTDLVAGRLHSADALIQAGGRGKPAPDVFLAAVAAEGVEPARCLVIEDSVLGVTAAVAAGMDCLGLGGPHRDGELMEAGAMPFRSMHDLPALLHLVLGQRP
jgi:beta-phosphoglucomutase-like phosphatase (HAD superfamily)